MVRFVRSHRLVLALVAASLATFARPAQRLAADSPAEWGEIAIGQPKIWQYERVAALLDGILRDIEGVSLADLTQLNASAQNGAAVRFLQTAVDVGVTYDQSAPVNARNAQQDFQIKHDAEVRRYDEYQAQLHTLTEQRAQVTKDLFAAQHRALDLQALKDQGTATGDDERALAAEKNRTTALTDQLTQVNTLISSLGTPPTVTATPTATATQAPKLPENPSFASLKELLDAVPSAKSALAAALSYPASRQLEDFKTLLHERLATEISVLQDDLTRDPDRLAFLVQFDVGIYPSKKAKDHVARVEFEINCPGYKIYSLYPGQSAYNIANFSGVSHRKSLAGSALTLVGFGINGAYRRQEDLLHGNLVQSVYLSGFVDADESAPHQRFGWYYGAAPFEQLVSPGIRSTFALVTVPEALSACGPAPASPQQATSPPRKFDVSAHTAWAKHDNPLAQKGQSARTMTVTLPGVDGRSRPVASTIERDRLHLLRIEYNTVYDNPSNPTPVASVDSFTACPKKQCAGILLTLDAPIDPNTVVTVAGRPLHRVRDWRGRATSILPPAQSGADLLGGTAAPRGQSAASRSLIESDQLEPNAWFPINSRQLLLNVSRELAGDENFPVIAIADPARRVLTIPGDASQTHSDVIVNGFRLVARSERQLLQYASTNFAATQNWTAGRDAAIGSGPYPESVFLPLFLPEPTPVKIYAYLGETGRDLLIGFLRDPDQRANSTRTPVWLNTRTQVILEDRDVDLAWALPCTPQGPQLSCQLPITSIRKSYYGFAALCAPPNSCPVLTSHLRGLQSWTGAVPAPLVQLTTLGFPASSSQANVYVPNLNVWVEQSDPAGGRAIYSPEPASLGLLPLSDNFFAQADEPFRPWHFRRATPENIEVEACRYFPSTSLSEPVVTLLGARTNVLQLPLQPPHWPPPPFDAPSCRWVAIPTREALRADVVLRVRIDEADFTVSVPAARLLPELGAPIVRSIKAQSTTNGRISTTAWELKFPVSRALCGDRLNVPAAIGVEYQWLAGGTPFNCVGAGIAEWQRADVDRRIELLLRIPKSAISQLSDEIRLIRNDATPPGTPGTDTVVATLPNLTKLLLPSTVAVETLGATKFLLRGEHAGEIDRVAIQNDQRAWIYTVVSGTNFALVDVSGPGVTTPSSTAAASTNGSGAEKPPVPGPGTYAILALVEATGDGAFAPLELAAPENKRLIFVRPDEKNAGGGAADKPDSVTKTTTVRTVEKSKPKPDAQNKLQGDESSKSTQKNKQP